MDALKYLLIFGREPVSDAQKTVEEYDDVMRVK
jgi:hypothetical protein